MYYSALFKNQAGRLSVKGFSIFCGLLIVEYKSDGILRPNDFIVSFHINTIKLHVLVGMKLYEQDMIGWQRVLWYIVKRTLCGSSDNI